MLLIVSCIAALTSLSPGISYITFLFQNGVLSGSLTEVSEFTSHDFHFKADVPFALQYRPKILEIRFHL